LSGNFRAYTKTEKVKTLRMWSHRSYEAQFRGFTHRATEASAFPLLLHIAVYEMLYFQSYFLRATAGTAIARLSHRNSVRSFVRSFVIRVDQPKKVQTRITKFYSRLPGRLLFQEPLSFSINSKEITPSKGAKW